MSELESSTNIVIVNQTTGRIDSVQQEDGARIIVREDKARQGDGDE